LAVSTGRLLLERVATGDRYDYGYAAMHFGGIDFYCLLRPFPGMPRFQEAERRIWEAARAVNLPALLKVAQEELGPDELGLDHVLPDGRQRISSMVLADIVHQLSDTYARFYQANQGLIDSLRRGGFELPRELATAAELTLGRQFAREIAAQGRSRDPAAYRRALKIAEDAARQGFTIDRAARDAAGALFTSLIDEVVREAIPRPTAEQTATVTALLALRAGLGVDVDLDRAQETLYDAVERGAARAHALPELAELGRALGLGPRLFEQAAAAPPEVAVAIEAAGYELDRSSPAPAET